MTFWVVCVWCCYNVNGGVIKWDRKYSFLIFSGIDWINWCYFLYKCLRELAKETIWDCHFLLFRVLNNLYYAFCLVLQLYSVGDTGWISLCLTQNQNFWPVFMVISYVFRFPTAEVQSFLLTSHKMIKLTVTHFSSLVYSYNHIQTVDLSAEFQLY